MDVKVSWSDIEDLRLFDNALKSLGDKKMREVANRALNKAGDQGRTKVKKALAVQTGLTQKRVLRYIKVKRSEWGKLEYRVYSSGRDIPLKYFKPKETRKGVSAAPFKRRRTFPGTFIKGGRFPNRVGLSGMGGHVFEREGRNRLGITLTKSGVNISEQMIKDASADAWQSTIARVLPVKLEEQIEQATDGVFS